MKIDTEIRHVTKPGANLFLELGFSAREAKRLHAASQQQINDTRLLKEQLMSELVEWSFPLDDHLNDAPLLSLVRPHPQEPLFELG